MKAPGFAGGWLLVVEGDPTLDILLMGAPEKNFLGVMKAGVWEKVLVVG